MDTSIPNITQMTIEVSDHKMVAHIKALLKQVSAVKSIKVKKVNSASKPKTGLELAYQDLEAGRVSGPFNSTEELFAHLGI